MAKKIVKVMNTAFRDGFQSVYGARVFTKDFLPAVEACREAGITHYEAGGGARFQSLYFYSNECAFDMMDAFREAAGPEANLQTLARGINVVGLESQSSDIIDLHAKLFKKHGITTIRNFDALNDVDNLTYSGKCIVDAGLNHEVVVTLMELPPGCEGAHTPEFYMGTLREILDAEIPYHSVCFKDASGTAVPSKVYETIKQARQMLPEGTHIRFHTHETAGVSVSAYRAALDAGADGIDLSMAPVSGGTCQPDIVIMWHALRGTDYELDCDIEKVREAELVFRDCMKDYYTPPEALAVEPMIPWAPMPGGALTANTQMMRDNNVLDKYSEVIAAMEEVVRRGGFGTSVTPVSQFYFQQAFNNVIFGPWEQIAEGYGLMVLGYYGKTPVPPDEEIVKIAAEKLGREPTTESPLKLNDADPKKGAGPARKALEEAGLPISDENIFIAATCKDKGIAYLKGEAKPNVRKIEKEAPKPSGGGAYTVTVDGKRYNVVFDGDTATVDGATYSVNVEEGVEEAAAGSSGGAAKSVETAEAEAVTARMPGNIMRIHVEPGDSVSEGEKLLVLESMKMEVDVVAPRDCKVASVAVNVGDQVSSGQTLIHIN